MVWGWFKYIAFIVYFISVIITSAPLQIIKLQIPEAGDPAVEELRFEPQDGEKAMWH